MLNYYGLNYHVKSVESSFFIDVKNDKVVYDSYGKFW